VSHLIKIPNPPNIFSCKRNIDSKVRSIFKRQKNRKIDIIFLKS